MNPEKLLDEFISRNKNIDKEYDGIIETRKDNKKIVITSNYIPIEIESDLENNTKVNVKITKIDNSNIIGKVINKG
jgi:tRNA A37 methylthiotransferase MiaB